MAELAGRTALVTGAGRGIGRQVAIQLALAGADVALAGRTLEHLEAVASEIRAHHRRTCVVTVDVADRGQVDAMMEEVREALGPPLILVSNAGIASSAPFHKTSDELWDQMLRINASGTFYCMRAALPAMLEAGWGRIITMASVAARAGAPYIAAYTASKHAVLGLTRALAAEVAGKGITVNAICPGYVDTDMTTNNVERLRARTGRPPEQILGVMERTSPQNRLMTVEEIAALAVFLCSEAARGINGQGIVVDGGGMQA